MRPVLTYYGGKQRLADWIISKFPKDYIHLHYVEPFFGGGAVFFKKMESRCETINDLDKKIYRFYNVFKNYPKALKDKFENFLYQEEEFNRAQRVLRGEIRAKSEIDFAYLVFISINSGFNASFNDSFKVRVKDKMTQARILQNKIDNFEQVFKRLKYTQILNKDVFKVIDMFKDQDDALFYLDPPYPGTVQQYNVKFSLEDFNRMLQVLKKVKFKFFLSFYETEGLNIPENMIFWFLYKKETTKTVCVDDKHIPSTECLLTNYEDPNTQYELKVGV